MLPLGPIRFEQSFAQQLLHSVTAQRAVACCCSHRLSRRKAGFGISTRKRWSTLSKQQDCEFQWTSKKVNLRLGVSPRAAAAAPGQLQSKTSAFVSRTRRRSKRLPALLINISCPISISYCALRLTSAHIRVTVTGIAIHAIYTSCKPSHLFCEI